MAINTTTRQTTAFTSGNNFAFQFKVYEVGDVKVIQIQTSNGAETVLTITTHYTVTLNDDQNANPGGTVTLVSSGSPQNLATGYNIVITSKVQPLQQTEITNQGGFFPEVINDVLDKAAILDQQQQSVIDKTIRFPLTQTVGGLEITENASNRANKIPQFDGSGDLAIGLITNSGLAADSVNSSQLVDGSIDTQHIGNLQVDTSKLAADSVNSSKIQDNAIDSEHYVDGSIDRIHLEADIIDSSKLADNSVNSEHYVDGSIDHVHLANDAVDGDNIADNSINSEHYVDGSIDNEHIADGTIQSSKLAGGISASQLATNSVLTAAVQDGQITSAKMHPDAVITSSEQAAATTNDTSFLTSAAADARFFNVSTGDTIKDGDSFPDNDTSIATTAAINDRIIDLINDVGGFTIIESEQHFPNTNPQGTTGQAAVLSVKAASTDLVPSGTTVTITNGNLANDQDIDITGVPSTIPSGFGFLIESTGTIHEYAFHRLVPKATEVTAVAGKAVEIGRLGTADAVADMNLLGTTDVVADMNMLATSDVIADMNLLATTDVIADMNLLAVADVISDMDVVATNVTNVNNVGNNITNVNNLTNSVGANQTLIVTVSGNKYFIDGVQTPVLKLARGKTYTFNLADSSNSGHPLAFRDSSDNAYTTGVTTSGTAGSSGATVVIVVAANAPNTLKYYCTQHGNSMGNTINVIDDNVGAVAGALTNINNVAGAVSNVNNVGGSIANVNTVASNLSSVNSFAETYRTGANNPAANVSSEGDLFYNTTSQSLKVYTGSAWVDGVTQTGNFALKTGNTFTGSNVHNDNVKSIYGTSSDGLEIFHNGSDSIIDDVGTGTLKLQLGGATKLEIQSGGIGVTGNIAVSGNVDGRDVSADGSKLDGIETGATADQTGAQIKSLYEAESDTNAFTDALLTKLNGIAASATNVTNNNQLTNGAGYITATLTNEQVQDIVGNMVSSNTESGITVTYQDSDGTLDFSVTSQTDNNFTTTLKNKLDGIEASATADQTASEIVALVADQTIAPSTIDMEDNEKIKLGTGDDLEIYHDGSHSYIHDAGTGNLKIKSSRVDILNSAGDEDMIVAVENGQVELHYDNSKKLETVNGGINVTGQVECDEIYLKDSEKILLGASSDLQIYHDGSNSYVSDLGTGNLKITTSGAGIDIDKGSSEHMARFKIDAECELYYNNGLCFETSAYGVKVYGGAHGNSDSHNGGTVTFDFSSAAYHFVNMNSNSTFAAPINSQIGHSGSIFLTQDGTGGRTGSFNSAFKFVGGSAPTLSTGANAVDRLDFIVLDDSPLTVHVAVSLDVK